MSELGIKHFCVLACFLRRIILTLSSGFELLDSSLRKTLLLPLDLILLKLTASSHFLNQI